jgi:8-oxo-dGTP pyrophosphatase MutT (NUDIX family)
MREVACVGALIRDARGRVFVQHRSATRQLLPDTWDIVGGHLEPGETPEQALAREIAEETGWTLLRIDAQVADWEWEMDGRVRREIDYLVSVDGALDAPQLEPGKHDAFAWIEAHQVDLMMVGRTDGDVRLRDIVARVLNTPLGDRRVDCIAPETR